jgi:lipopolysaccharide/colanic/teichoic acid biosynthesis glycosyltransferase
MSRRVLDALFALIVLVVFSPVLILTIGAIYFYDFHSPFYRANRVGRGGRLFPMLKFRSMIVNADKVGGTSTSASDSRITPVGKLVRRYKLDELPQFWNVLVGDMSVVGPRPNVPSGVAVYTEAEKHLLDVRPGVTDLASIVFSDEGDILKDKADPDVAYNQLIRPGKSLLGLFYIQHRVLWLDLRLIVLTAVAIVSRERALLGVQRILRSLGASHELLSIAARQRPLVPMPPPGATQVVNSPDGKSFA